MSMYMLIINMSMHLNDMVKIVLHVHTMHIYTKISKYDVQKIDEVPMVNLDRLHLVMDQNMMLLILHLLELHRLQLNNLFHECIRYYYDIHGSYTISLDISMFEYS